MTDIGQCLAAAVTEGRYVLCDRLPHDDPVHYDVEQAYGWTSAEFGRPHAAPAGDDVRRAAEDAYRSACLGADASGLSTEMMG